MKIVKKNQLKIVFFTAVKNCSILHGHVFVMACYSLSYCSLLNQSKDDDVKNL